MAEEATKGTCFVVCPIGADGSDERKHSDQVLRHIILPAARASGYTAERSIDQDRPGVITSQIINQLADAPMVVADLSFLNPNVFYELAVRHATRQPVVLICEEQWKLPFDLSDTNTIRFTLTDPDSVASGRDRLERQIRIAAQHPDDVDNPVSASIELKALRAGIKPQERRDAMVLERLEALSFDVQSLGDAIGNRKQGRYVMTTSGTGDTQQTTIGLDEPSAPDVPAFTKWFAESSPGWFMQLLKENEIIPRRRPLKDYWEVELERHEQRHSLEDEDPA